MRFGACWPTRGSSLRDVTHVAMARDPKANPAAKMAYVAHGRSRPPGRWWSISGATAEPRAPGAAGGDLRRGSGCVSSRPSTSSITWRTSPAPTTCRPSMGSPPGLSYDASGDFASMMAARCEGNRIEVLDRVTLPHSLGFFYTALCQFIGFDEFGEEYKVMGLAPYGEDRYGELMRELVRLDDGRLVSAGAGAISACTRAARAAPSMTRSTSSWAGSTPTGWRAALGEPRGARHRSPSGRRTSPAPPRCASRRRRCTA